MVTLLLSPCAYLQAVGRYVDGGLVFLCRNGSRYKKYTPGHGLDALSSVVLVVTVAGDVLQVVHVGSYQNVPQLHEVAVRRVLHCTQEKISIRAGRRSRMVS